MSQAMIKVGFIGLGRMGVPMAANVRRAGYDLTVYDVRKSPVGELVRLGASAANCPADVAEQSELIELAVVDDAQVEEVLTGRSGVFEKARSGTLVAVHSTVFPKTVKNLPRSAKRRAFMSSTRQSAAAKPARGKKRCAMSEEYPRGLTEDGTLNHETQAKAVEHVLKRLDLKEGPPLADF